MDGEKKELKLDDCEPKNLISHRGNLFLHQLFLHECVVRRVCVFTFDFCFAFLQFLCSNFPTFVLHGMFNAFFLLPRSCSCLCSCSASLFLGTKFSYTMD